MRSSNYRVLVTGATGFIGGRLVEGMYLSGIAIPVAGVRSWASAARIGRFAVDMVPCDVLNITQLAEAMQEADAVVHCAAGSRDVIVEGTRNVVEAALRQGLDQVVHISTVDVYGDVSGDIDEDSELNYTGNPYGDAKIDAEHICWEYAERGLSLTILRPGIVYGPFSTLWTTRFAERLVARKWGKLSGFGEGVCNLIYVDDLVRAVFVALFSEHTIGGAFNINGFERVTWNDYFDRFNNYLELDPLPLISSEASKTKALLMMPVRSIARTLLDRYGDAIMGIYSGYPAAKHLMKAVETRIKNTPSRAELDIYQRTAYFSPLKAQHVMGFSPRFSIDDGLRLTAQWLRHHDYC